MERTVPSTASEEIDLYLRTIYSLLRSTTDVQIRTLEEVHAGMNSSLHVNVRQSAPDTSAFIYSLLRLPACISDTRLVVLGQSSSVFSQYGYQGIETWQEVSARARRRRCFYDGQDTLACLIASRSDIEDVIPMLTAYQIEWNKMHDLLEDCPEDLIRDAGWGEVEAVESLSDHLQVSAEDLERLRSIWGDDFSIMLQQIAAAPISLRVRLLSGSLSDYWRATRSWLQNIQAFNPALLDRPVYFISSNLHALPNLLTGVALAQENKLIAFLRGSTQSALRREWEEIEKDPAHAGRENFLYYLFKKYQQSGRKEDIERSQAAIERSVGMTRVKSEHYFDVDAQVIEIKRLDPQRFDPRLQDSDLAFLSDSDALILNIDYPLGLAAYNILSKVAEFAWPILGVYSMGKAASLNGALGDVMIPNVVHDEHSQNTYLFQNTFTAADVSKYLVYGTVLDNQKAVCVKGTFLQNSQYMDVFYREGYTDIEMESGPYLSAVYEMYRPKRHPSNEIVNLYQVPFDLGFIHYASDTPLSKGKNLGAGTLSYYGMDSTYAASIAILQRIFKLERERTRRRVY
ncbi:MAG TPA: hypothetical protein VHO48_01910 [Anaerolineaceae bacterium]|nr:hypothetical protein [Anaerolineaceae bacterium]